MNKPTIKGLLASAAAIAVAGAAFAQSTPPDPSAKDPSIGAGQRSTQQTPMGATGTPTNRNGSAATTGSSSMGTTGSAAATPSTSSGSYGNSSMGASGTSSTDMSSTETKTTGKHKARKSKTAHRKAAKADRN